MVNRFSNTDLEDKQRNRIGQGIKGHGLMILFSHPKSLTKAILRHRNGPKASFIMWVGATSNCHVSGWSLWQICCLVLGTSHHSLGRRRKVGQDSHFLKSPYVLGTLHWVSHLPPPYGFIRKASWVPFYRRPRVRQQSLRKSSTYHTPYYWVPAFVLITIFNAFLTDITPKWAKNEFLKVGSW